MPTLNAVAVDLTAYWQGDAPAAPIEVQFSDLDGNAVELPTGPITATLLAPTSAAEPVPAEVTDVDADTIAVSLPGTFTSGGVWELVFRAEGIRFSTLAITVQRDDGWMSLWDARDAWADAPTSDVVLYRLLESAREACLNYRAEPIEARPTPGHVQGQIMQARAIWQATRAETGDQLGAEGYTVRVYPLDNNVRALLRPRTGRPHVR